MDYLEALTILKTYGLDAILSDRDDPKLWAAALSKYWPLLDDPRINVDGLKFGIGEFDDTVSTKIKISEHWRFAWMDNSQLKVVQYRPSDDDQAKTTEEAFWGTIDDVTTEEEIIEKLHQYYSSMGYPSITLTVTRPSKDEDKAIVFHAYQGTPLMGHGESRIWLHQTDGNWQPNPKAIWGYES